MNTLGDAAIFASGGTPKRDDPSYWGGEIPWYSASNMTKRFIGDTSVRITDEGLRAGSRIAPAGATLILTRGSGLFNHVPICFAERDVAFNQDVKALIAKDHVDPVFLHYWMESLRPILNRNIGVTGIGAGKFDLSFLSSLPFPHLERAEQERIGKEADAFDRKIALNTSMNETLEATARALFRDWFVDFGPVRAKMEGRGPYLAPDMWALFPDLMDGEEKPKGWGTGTLSSLAAISSESWSDKKHPSSLSYLDLSSVKWGKIEGQQVLQWEDAPSRARRIIRRGDTVVGMVRPGNGSYAYINHDGSTGSTGFAVIRPRQAALSPLVWCHATSPLAITRLANLADGGAYPAVRPDQVSDTPINLATDAINTAFTSTIFPLLDRMEANRRECETLALARDHLLPRLLSGEFRVADAIQIAEAA